VASPNPPPAFEARLLPISWVIPGFLIGMGLLLALIPSLAAPSQLIGWLLLAFGVVLGVLRWTSRITLRGGVLEARFFWIRSSSVSLARLAGVTARASKASLRVAPALDLRAADGTRATIRLGWWRRETELLGILADAASRTGATVDAQAAALLRDRPPAEWWSPSQRQARAAATRPPSATERLLGRLPRPLRFPAQLVAILVFIVLVYGGMELAARLGENVLFPRRIDPAWTTQLDLPPTAGDSWLGNVATDGERIYLAARQTVVGFWGTLRVWRSDDGGATWTDPVLVSHGVDPNAARHALAVAPDGSVWVAFAERGPQVATQRLIVRVSRDHGETWSAEENVAPDSIGTVGVPTFLLTDEIRLIAYTSGVTGVVLVSPLTEDGETAASPLGIGQTQRQLYSDEPFADGAPALVQAGDRIAAVWVEGSRSLAASFSSDGGASWRPSTGIDQDLHGGWPRLATDGSTILLAATDPNRGARHHQVPFIRIWRSEDGGETFTRGPNAVTSARIGWLELVRSGDRWRLAYAACPGFISCATPSRLWYADSRDGAEWSEPVVVSEPGDISTLGLIDGSFGLAAVWGTELSSHDWTFHLARRSP
jgi:hypothetical protein